MEKRMITFGVNLPVLQCQSCEEKFVLMTVRDTYEIDVDTITYTKEEFTYCPHCGTKHNH